MVSAREGEEKAQRTGTLQLFPPRTFHLHRKPMTATLRPFEDDAIPVCLETNNNYPWVSGTRILSFWTHDWVCATADLIAFGSDLDLTSTGALVKLCPGDASFGAPLSSAKRRDAESLSRSRELSKPLRIGSRPI